MALERSIKQFFFAKGPNSEITNEAIQDGELSILENARLDVIGSVRHKLGTLPYEDDVINGGSVTNLGFVESVDTYNDSPIVFGKAIATSAAPSTRFKWNDSINKWSTPRSASSAILRSFSVGRQASSFIITDCVVYDGLIYAVMVQEGFSYFSIIDPDSGDVISINGDLNSADKDLRRIIVFNNKIYYFVLAGGAGNTLVAYCYDPATAATTSVNLLTDLDSTFGSVYDVWLEPTNNIVYVAYRESAAGKLYVKGFSDLTVPTLLYNLTTIYNVGLQLTICGVTVGLAAPRIIVALSNPSEDIAFMLAYTTALAAAFGPVNLYVGLAGEVRSIVISPTVYSAEGSVCVTIKAPDTVTPTLTVTSVIVYGFTSAAGTGARFISKGNEVFSKPLTIGDRDYIWLKGSSVGQECYYLATTRYSGATATSQFYIVGKIYSGQGGPSTAGPYLNSRTAPMQISPVSHNGKRFVGGMRLISALSATSQIYSQSLISFDIGEYQFHPDAWQRWKGRKISGCLAQIGGYLNFYDGEINTELNFPEYPDSSRSVFTSFNGPGTITPLGVYSICLVFEYIDALGRAQLSAPSVPVSITLGAADDTIRIAFYNNCNGITSKLRYNVLVYRTTNAGTIYYFDRRVSGSASAFLTFDLTQADTTLSQSASLYTQSGELENNCVPAPIDIAIFKDRLFVLTDEGLFYSKKVELGDPLEFSEALQIPIESDGGKALAIEAIQDKLIVFKKSRVYYIVGDGPNDTGTYGDFSLPALLTAKYGCISPRSVIQDGSMLYFQSTATMCVLDSSMAVTEIDDSLSYYWKDQPILRSAVSFPDYKMIKWTDGYKSFVYFPKTQQWAIYPVSACDSETLIPEELASFRFNTRLFVFSQTLYKETEDNILETNAIVVPMIAATGWLQLGNIEGFQRLYSFFLLGRKRGQHNLTISIMYDYVPVIVETHTINNATEDSYIYTDAQVFEGAAAVAATGTDQTNKPYQYRIKTSRQKCEAIRILIQDDDESGGVGTVDLVAGAFEIGFKNTGVKMWAGSGRTV